MRTILLILLIVANSAFAEGKSNGRSGNADVNDSSSASGAASTAFSNAESRADATGGVAKAQGGSASAAGGTGEGGQGVGTVSTENDSTFFAFGTTFPNGFGCFVGAQAGGGGSGGAGFAGIHYLSHNCWMAELASRERHVQTRAMLQCDAKKFRDAIAYDQPKGEVPRQTYCINYMVDVYKQEIADMQKTVDDGIATGLIQIREDLVTERDAVCDEKLERCAAAALK